MRVEAEEPQREPLAFDLQLDGLPQEYVDALLNIKRVAENILFHWKTFPIVLPKPVAVPLDGEASKKKTISLKDVFVTPTFDEVDAVALDARGEPRMLSQKQLNSIQEFGEFEVESINFPGHCHCWRLSQLLQKGSARSRESLLNDVAIAMRLIVVTGWNRVVSHFFSLFQAVLALRHGFFLLGDAIFGMSALCNENLVVKLREERSKYLVAEMNVPPQLEEDLDFLCLFIKQQIQKQKMEKYDMDLEAIPSVPYLYQTPKGATIDLRLFNKDLMKKALPCLMSILEKEARGWFLHFREKVVAEFKTQKLPNAEIERRANAAIVDEYLRRVYGAILGDADLRQLGLGIGRLLIEQAHSIILMHRSVENVQAQWTTLRHEIKQALCESHPILSRITPWMCKHVQAAEAKFFDEHRWVAHIEALQSCRDGHLNQAAYFLHRDLVFMREREPVLLKELSRVKTPMRMFDWRAPIWFPKNWVVRKVFRGESEIVPTAFGKASTSASASRADPGEPVFLVEKQVTRVTSTCWPFWRWTNFIWRMWAWLWNAMFIFGVVIPWCSPCSFRALFSFAPFMTDLEPCAGGTLVPRRSSMTLTLCSRLVSLWRHISKSRTEFESRPDRGFIGKGLARHINRLWNYLLKGVFGTLALICLFPVVCIVVSSISMLVALTAVLWVPVVAFLFHMTCILVYDSDSPDSSRNRWCLVFEGLIWNILIQGIFQPLLTFILAAFVCPLIAFVILILAVVRRSFRFFWDATMFHIVIKKRGRIPASDSFLVKRMAGPGMTSEFYYQIVPEQALAAFEAKMELDELNAYHDEMEQLIQRPQLVFSEFVKVCFHPFSAALAREGNYQMLEKEACEWRASLREQVDRRRRELNPGLGVTTRSKIKMTTQDLKVTIKTSAVLLERFYSVHVISRLPVQEEEFWANRGLSFRDWSGIAAQMLVEIFSQEILTPLDESDDRFSLGTQNVNLSHFSQLMVDLECRDDLDVVGTVHAPRGNIQVHSPYLNVAIFNPTAKKEVTSRPESSRKRNLTPWKLPPNLAALETKLKIPLPLPHPVHVAVVVYNREADDPIVLEGEGCRSIMKALEDRSARLAAAIPSCGSGFVNVDLTPAESIVDERDSEHNDSSLVVFDSEEASTHRRRNSNTVNLASSEDITLELDIDRVTYSHGSYGTTV